MAIEGDVELAASVQALKVAPEVTWRPSAHTHTHTHTHTHKAAPEVTWCAQRFLSYVCV
jgi:hypothetical protein